MQQGESLEAAKEIIKIWEGFDLPGFAKVFHLDYQEVQNILRVMKELIQLRKDSMAAHLECAASCSASNRKPTGLVLNATHFYWRARIILSP